MTSSSEEFSMRWLNFANWLKIKHLSKTTDLHYKIATKLMLIFNSAKFCPRKIIFC